MHGILTKLNISFKDFKDVSRVMGNSGNSNSGNSNDAESAGFFSKAFFVFSLKKSSIIPVRREG
jgi:hypothetical protein